MPYGTHLSSLVGSGFANWNPDPEEIREESGTLSEGHDAG
jgi:hypothetical protein